LTSPGPSFFRQVRCGLNGRHFTLVKFRTMEAGAEERRSEIAHLNEMSGPVFKAARDPRRTLVGRLLRRLSIDELPQLWNVIVGDMSLVGPRPPLPEEVFRYEPWQRRRLSMKPGLTCLWQVSGRSELDFDRWMALDLKYIDTWSPLLDLKILLKTVPAVLSGRGARLFTAVARGRRPAPPRLPVAAALVPAALRGLVHVLDGGLRHEQV